MNRLRCALASYVLALLAGRAKAADLNVGVTLSATGPAASIGIPTRKAIALLPTTIGSAKVNYIVLDDGTDSTTAVKNVRKLTSENAVDVLMGSNSTPASLAMVDVAAETGTPLVSLAAGKRIIAPMDERRRWAFKTPQNDDLMAEAGVDHLSGRGGKTAAFIGFADAYGEGWWTEFSKAAEARGIRIVANERTTGRIHPSRARRSGSSTRGPTPSSSAPRGRRRRCRKKASSGAATRGSSTTRTAWPTRTSYGWAARTSKGLSFR